jgi:membrane protease YdiL (CAAX protease family)
VLLEEVAFRGVLWGLLRRARGTATATVVSSLLFGLWHALPSLGLASANQAISGTVGTGRSGELVTVLATIAFTGLAGVVFCELRRRSGSLLAPAGLHWSVNGFAVLASAAVWAWATP